MRRYSQKGYTKKAELYSKNFNTNVISDIPKYFRYKELNTTHTSNQHIGKFMMTDTTTKIETVSELVFQVGDKVVINGSRAEIQDIEYIPYKVTGALRGIERYKKVITLP